MRPIDTRGRFSHGAGHAHEEVREANRPSRIHQGPGNVDAERREVVLDNKAGRESAPLDTPLDLARHFSKRIEEVERHLRNIHHTLREPTKHFYALLTNPNDYLIRGSGVIVTIIYNSALVAGAGAGKAGPITFALYDGQVGSGGIPVFARNAWASGSTERDLYIPFHDSLFVGNEMAATPLNTGATIGVAGFLV